MTTNGKPSSTMEKMFPKVIEVYCNGSKFMSDMYVMLRSCFIRVLIVYNLHTVLSTSNCNLFRNLTIKLFA